MNRLELPNYRIIWETGDVALWADLDLLVKDGSDNWRRRRFRIDTGTELSTMSAHEAKRLGLRIPADAAPGVTHRQTGLEIRSGLLCFQVIGMDTTEYAISCFFLGDPNTPPNPNRPASFPRKLLQPLSLLDQFRFHLDKDSASIGAPHGIMTIEKKIP